MPWTQVVDLYVQSVIQKNSEIVKIKIIFQKFINSTVLRLPVNNIGRGYIYGDGEP